MIYIYRMDPTSYTHQPSCLKMDRLGSTDMDMDAGTTQTQQLFRSMTQGHNDKILKIIINKKERVQIHAYANAFKN